MDEIYQRADAFLFGRRTYEIFAGTTTGKMNSPDTALDLVDSRVTPNGVTMLVTGPPAARDMQPPPSDTGAAVSESRHPQGNSVKLRPDP